MASTQGVWAIDIGTNALKALRLREGEEGLEVIGFDYVEHREVLSSGEVDEAEKEEIIDDTLRRFLGQNEIGKEQVAISIAGQNSFARFIKLPPVEPKKIPEIVQFEAVQQIPFDINEVEWDWQLMDMPDSPDAEVGIFAIKNELIAEVMDHFTNEELRVSCVQIAPMALYNYACYDLKEIADSPNKAVIVLDMGAENTTLVVCTRDSVWQRSIRIGGNTFTQAIADAFKLNFRKAEKLKRKAPVSKYMRQIYTAMKPVYTELGSEIQRSLGFYTGSAQGRNKTFTHMVATGGGMKLQGLAKYLQQSSGITVIKPDSFERLKLSADVSPAKFHENVSDFAIVYGLGVQLFGQAKIQTNLLPRRIARAMAWTQKARIFTIAAGVLALVMLLGVGRAFRDLRQVEANRPVYNEVASVISQVQGVQGEVSNEEGRKQPLLGRVERYKSLFERRDVVPKLNETLLRCLPNADNTPQQAALYEAFQKGDVAGVVNVPRSERRQLFLTRVVVEPAPDVSAAAFPQADVSRQPTRRTTTRAARAPVGGGEGDFMPMGMPMDMPWGMPQDMPAYGGDPGAETAATKRGFVLLIEGYSPYARIADLLDPHGVGDNERRWGFVTRLANLKTLLPELPFELFEKGDISHFRLETGRVDLTSDRMPGGIGVIKEIERVPHEPAQQTDRTTRAATAPIQRGAVGRQRERITVETVLVDPMTQEEISRTYDIYTAEDVRRDPDLSDRDIGRVKLNPFGEQQYIDRDHWFRIQAKFLWKDPAQGDAMQDMDGMNDMGMGMGGGFF